MINMGDFNVHHSSEGSYQKLVNPADSNYIFYDPPFYPDGNFTYPADWDNFPSSYSSFLTTSTRKSLSNPNSCGTDGGGKSWYDHMFISSSIAHHTAGIYYIPHSFKVLGNDGNRVGVSVNSSPTNTSAPSNVITALFQMSNKYPIVADFEVSSVFPAALQSNAKLDATIRVVNPVTQNLVLQFPSMYWKKTLGIACYDLLGQCILKQNLFVDGPNAQLDFNVSEGVYFLRCTDENKLLQSMPILKK
jgi:hypothetical protein